MNEEITAEDAEARTAFGCGEAALCPLRLFGKRITHREDAEYSEMRREFRQSKKEKGGARPPFIWGL